MERSKPGANTNGIKAMKYVVFYLNWNNRSHFGSCVLNRFPHTVGVSTRINIGGLNLLPFESRGAPIIKNILLFEVANRKQNRFLISNRLFLIRTLNLTNNPKILNWSFNSNVISCKSVKIPWRIAFNSSIDRSPVWYWMICSCCSCDFEFLGFLLTITSAIRARSCVYWISLCPYSE